MVVQVFLENYRYILILGGRYNILRLVLLKAFILCLCCEAPVKQRELPRAAIVPARTRWVSTCTTPRLENRNRQHVGFREQSMKASDGSGTRLETPLQRGAKRENVLLVQHAISLRNGTGGDRGLDTVQRLDLGEPHRC